MKKWPTKPLGEVTLCVDNRRIPVKESDRLKRAGSVPYYGANGQVGWIDEPIYNEPLLLIAEDGGHFDEPERGVAYTITGPSWINNHAHALRADERKVRLGFLGYYFRHYNFRHYLKGTTRAKLNKSDLMRVPVPLPPLDEQERIVALLDEADDLRKLRAQADERTASLVSAFFAEVFGDPISNPKGWALRSFADIGTLDRGRSRHRPRDEASLYGGRYPFIQTGDIANADGVITTYSQTYSEKGLAQSRLWPAGTLCITIAANIGETAILRFPACFPDSVVGFIPGEMVVADYVRQWLVYIQSRLEDAAPQMAQKNINLKILRELTIPVPPLALQNEFATRVSEIRALEVAQANSREQLDGLFQALLHRAFRGEL